MSEKQKHCLSLTITVVVEEDGSGYHAYCPALEGVHVYGDTCEEALENSKDAVVAYLDSLVKHNDPLPVGPDLSAERKDLPSPVPAWMIHQITLPCPTPKMSGTR